MPQTSGSLGSFAAYRPSKSDSTSDSDSQMLLLLFSAFFILLDLTSEDAAGQAAMIQLFEKPLRESILQTSHIGTFKRGPDGLTLSRSRKIRDDERKDDSGEEGADADTFGINQLSLCLSQKQDGSGRWLVSEVITAQYNNEQKMSGARRATRLGLADDDDMDVSDLSDGQKEFQE